ncbi:MAG: type II toxin-antitoxin system RelE/ParE family toxin [Opitutaceae bacterium]
MKGFAFHREAGEEFLEALRHYAAVEPSLGNRFYDEIHRLITQACETPGAFRYIEPPVRRHFSDDFPYGILYVERAEDIWILAVMHLHRNPRYWQSRLSQP